jgi:hypothetical protein
VQIPETGTTAGKVMRGGSWRENTQPHYQNPEIESTVDRKHVRVSKRDYGCPSNLSDRTGFRCAANDMRFTPPIFLKPITTLRKPKSVPAYRWPNEYQDPAVFKE